MKKVDRYIRSAFMILLVSVLQRYKIRCGDLDHSSMASSSKFSKSVDFSFL